jgi:hypothetical protein
LIQRNVFYCIDEVHKKVLEKVLRYLKKAKEMGSKGAGEKLLELGLLSAGESKGEQP